MKFMNQHQTNNELFKVFNSTKLSQKDFAESTGTDKHSIHDWLKNKNEMKFSKLNQILNVLGLKATIKIEKL
jgi:transcriptional regulator with XRE-family HTH domain